MNSNIASLTHVLAKKCTCEREKKKEKREENLSISKNRKSKFSTTTLVSILNAFPFLITNFILTSILS